jgi:oxygen-independent coproporphyrinogen-3 oxidase
VLIWVIVAIPPVRQPFRMTDADLVARYTSYPTAPQFSPTVGAVHYALWLAALPSDAGLSLYLHVPFCDRLCLYCGCNTAVVHAEAPRRLYAAMLERELRLVAGHIGHSVGVTHLHWGGGTPTTLPADCLTHLMRVARSAFRLAPDAEIAVEIDPAMLPPDRLAALAEMGVTRASLGVQDLDPSVQAAIGRTQSYEETLDCAQALRRFGVRSLNLDLIYGLPLQTEASVKATARCALGLDADRIAVFGYAHVPWMKRHQRLIPDATLPSPAARFAQRRAIGDVLETAGYLPIGLDHYAKPDDAMAAAARGGTLRRSFQGYTTDAAPALIGLGASAIGSLPQGYVQNAPTSVAYMAALRDGKLATGRGVALSDDDRLRRQVIERLMCDLRADLPPQLLDAAAGLDRFVADGLVRLHDGVMEVTEAGRPFVRSVAAVFDAYLDRDTAAPRHAQAV